MAVWPMLVAATAHAGFCLVAESGRFRHTLKVACAKRPHGRLRRLSAELENVGEASDFLERRAHGRVPAAFWKNPEKIWLKLAKIQQIVAKFAKIWKTKQQQIQQFLTKILRLESSLFSRFFICSTLSLKF